MLRSNFGCRQSQSAQAYVEKVLKSVSFLLPRAFFPLPAGFSAPFALSFASPVTSPPIFFCGAFNPLRFGFNSNLIHPLPLQCLN
jgi:hypothetical protein